MASAHLRHFGCLPLEARVAHQRLIRICFSDYDREIALVAGHGKGATRKIIAVGRLNRLHSRNASEFAVLVSDTWRSHGLGTSLMKALIQIGRAEKLERITGTILRDNHGMLSICHALGFHLHHDTEAEALTADLSL